MIQLTPRQEQKAHRIIQLTPRQQEVVKRVTSGETLKAIALEQGRSRKTVEFHWDNARKRIGFNDVARVTQWALKHRLIDFSV